ncbi:SusC/RagA family TonB-linked outer membrane protein [Flavobacterium branchiophilum]|uniref:SusC/RagA family TonB-linked outer membrane protein n=1 Tax=Flavobacterium branchiophilum TaxID=55197 RepID=UPI001E524DCB|nr:SusC/RagA family TonB-linked outer membrane protein [Flavobacterium branchiophilum]
MFLTMVFTGFAQAQSVSGKISDSSGPLPGASVTVKGTTNSVQSDLDGNYAIKNVGNNAVLVFSYIGLKSQEINVAGKTVINVVLKDDKSELKEVVVIGYGSVKKKDATGAVDQISSKKFDNVSAPSPAEILRGKVAGVQVTSSNGEPGAAASIRIRGNGSLRSGNEPLIVIDGVPLAGGDVSSGGADMGLGGSSAKNPLSFINQNDIESMSILKDASSTAIYGARGANGVIVITTKKGKTKEPQLTFSTSVSTSKLSTDFDVLSTQRFAELAPTGSNKGGSYNWKDAIMRSGFSFNNDVSYSSGTDKSSTRISLGSSQTEGIVKNTGMNKYTATLFNSNSFFNGNFTVETRINYANIQDERTLFSNNTGYIGNLMGAALYWNPTRSLYNPNGTYYVESEEYLNPLQLLDNYSNKTDLDKLIGNITSTVKLSKDLKYVFTFGIETSKGITKAQLLPTIAIKDVAVANNPQDGLVYRGQANLNTDVRVNKTFEHNFTYNKDFSDNFKLNAILGYSYYDYSSNGNATRGKGYNINQTNLVDNIEGGITSEFVSESYRGRVEMQSFFARTSLSLYKKMNVDLTVRRDGSSKPGLNNKYGNFGSIGLAYKLIENKEGSLNDLKIRGNFGTTGNAEFPRNSSTSFGQYYNTIFVLANNPNQDLKWETTRSSGVGIDFTVLKSRLTGSMDYYVKETKDLIVANAPQSGQPSPQGVKFENLDGKLKNSGFELSLNYKILNQTDLTWDFSVNAAFLKNEISGLTTTYNIGQVHGQGLSNAYVEQIKNGYPLYSYYLPNFVGYDASGNSLYLNPDGSTVGSTDALPMHVGKQPLPKTTLGFSTSVAYKNWDFSTSFYGSFGHYIYNNTSNALFNKSAFGFRNVTESVATSAQSIADSNKESTRYLEKGDFLRMGSLTIGYNFKADFLTKLKISSLRLYANGSNLLLFTNYSGFDPEVDTDKTVNSIPSAGIDYFSYPKAKTFAFGLNVTF